MAETVKSVSERRDPFSGGSVSVTSGSTARPDARCAMVRSLYCPAEAFIHDSSEGVAEPSSTGTSLAFPRQTARSRAENRSPSPAL